MSESVRAEFLAIGQRLREARARRGLSVEAALEKLHCTPEVLQALEQGRFERLGAAVFVRGHLKRYAELLGEPAEEILAQWSGAGAVATPDLTQRPQAPRQLALAKWGRIAAYAALALVLAALAWAVLRFATPAVRAVAPAPVQPQSLPALREPPLAPLAATAATPLTAPSATSTAAPSAVPDAAAPVVALPAVAAPPVAAPPPGSPLPDESAAGAAAGRVTVAGSFAEPCWVDVTDATGRRLYYGLVPAGGRVSLTGVAPFRVLLGVRSAATLQVAGRGVAIPSGPPGVRSTRFELAADGTVLPPTN